MSNPTGRLTIRLLTASALFVMLALATCGTVIAEEAQAGPADAEEAFSGERYGEAAAIYAALLAEHGPSADLFYNLGVTRAAAGEHALATLAFERALALEPGSEDVLDALEASREALHAALLAESADRSLTRGASREVVWWRFFRSLGTRWPALALLIGWQLVFGCLIARRLMDAEARKPLRDVLGFVAALAALLVLASGSYLGGQLWTDDLRPGVVTAEEAELLESPSELASAETHHDLYAGALVRILDERDGWLRVELVDGTRGWLHRDDIGEVRVDRWPVPVERLAPGVD